MASRPMPPPIYASPAEKTWHYAYRVICAAVFVFLIGQRQFIEGIKLGAVKG